MIATNSFKHLFLHVATSNSLGDSPKRGMARSKDVFIFNFTVFCQIAFQKFLTQHISTEKNVKVVFPLILPMIGFIALVNFY